MKMIITFYDLKNAKIFKLRKLLLILVSLLVVFGCEERKKDEKKLKEIREEFTLQDSITDKSGPTKEIIDKIIPLASLPDTTFIRLADYSDEFAYDMRYATENNFLKAMVYDCPECYTRVKTAKALIAANKEFLKNGVKIKFFDCYRPNSVQYKMWEIVPNPQYVANPVKGSIHNKGGAVDPSGLG